MSMTDPIADMLTRIRNANTVSHERVELPASRVKAEIARILTEEGYIRNYRLINDGKQGILRIYLKYGDNQEKVISGLKRNQQTRAPSVCRSSRFASRSR